MKRIFVLLLTACMIAAAFIGCAQKPGFGSSSADTNGNGLRDDVELTIMKHYHKTQKVPAKFAVKNYQVQYFGSFDDVSAILIWYRNAAYPAWAIDETIGGVVFSYSRDNKIKVWYNGDFYTLQDMYDQKLLTYDDLVLIKEEYEEQAKLKYYGMVWE